jgi:DNA-directed RNA polymerase subunit N (RpoN/RPB10)
MPSKQCFKCGITKALDDFYAHKQMADGHLNKCKECTKADIARHRHGEAGERVREYDRLRAKLPHRVQHAKAMIAKWKVAHPDRRKAQMVLGYAVKRGDIVPLPCFVCGDKAEAHHPDYSAPLDVMWLCPPHHKQAHAIARR